ncbi:MAG: CHC2 zinc finger domain-containing protein [bacterium]
MAYIDAAEKYLQFKKIGKNYFAICPFHEEKTASLQLDPVSGLWHCFGCGAAGNIWQFIMRMESVNFPESVEIGKEYGVEPPDNFIERNKRFADKETVDFNYNSNKQTLKEDATIKQDIKGYINNKTSDNFNAGKKMNKRFTDKEIDELNSIDYDDDAVIENDSGDDNIKAQENHTHAQEENKIKLDSVSSQNIAVKPKSENKRFADKETNKKTAIYIYDDESGSIVFEKERWEKFKNGERISKSFSFYHYDGAKRIVGKGEGKQILYNLKDVLDSETVFICEGEKDCDNLKKIWTEKNCAFTTNSSGAEHWENDFNVYLKGKNIFILEDNDESGRKRTDILTRNLKDICKSIAVVKFDELDDHGDVSDYLEQFGIESLNDKINAFNGSIQTNEKKLDILDVFELRFLKDENEYILNNFLPLKKNKINTVSGAHIEFFIYLSLILSKKFNVVFLSGYDIESLRPLFKNIILRIDKNIKKDIKNVNIGKLSGHEINGLNIDEESVVVSTKSIKGNRTAICPSNEFILPDYYFKNGDVYDKFWKKILRIENLRGAGDIKIIRQEEKKKQPMLSFNIFKKIK